MIVSLPALRCTALVLAVSAFVVAGFARAEDPPRSETTAPAGQKGGRGSAAQSAPSAVSSTAEPHRLPSDSTTKQTIDLPGRTLNFAATAGSIRVFDGKGEPLADIAYTSYELGGADRATRPVTFLFNGGPGASSAWLQFGAAGPWRLP
ncbi:hypothetical protein PMI42_02418, partial [Bradyrhizobium sp. YR681]